MGRFSRMRRSFGALVAAAALAPVTLVAGTAPYDESADADATVAAALRTASAEHKHVLVVFGANWCPDCRALDAEFTRARTADLLARKFVVVKVDVGRFDKNLALAKRYGNPIRKGIPSVVVVKADGNDVYATCAGELADARSMGSEAIGAFFEKLVEREKL